MIKQVVFDPEGELGTTPRPALLEWLVGEGQQVEMGQPLCRYEVDKAISTFDSPRAGFLRRQLVPEGARFSSRDVLAFISENLTDTLPAVKISPLPNENDIRDFDWSEVDNRGGAPEPLGVMRRAIADRMAMAKRHIPCFYLTATVDMTGCIALRNSLKRSGRRATFNDMAIKASALALRQNPRASAIYTPQGLIPRDELHIGFAAALPDEGLVVPVVKHADRKCLTDISFDTRLLTEKAKKGELAPQDCSGGVFSVSYLGSYEVDNFVAIVNPGEAAILAMGKTIEKPAVIDGTIEIRPMASLTLSCDHRSIDGSLAARLMGDIKRHIEHPEGLVDA